MPKTKVNPLTDNEVQKIINSAIDKSRDYLILRLLAKTGARIGELSRFNVGDIDFAHNVIYIPIAKRDERREIPFDQLTANLIRFYIADKKITGPLWKISYSQLQRLPGQYAKKAGVSKKVSPHSFRHYFGTTLIRNGLDPFEVKRLMGHRSLTTTDIYTHIAPIDIMASYEKIMGQW